eukprot:scaffold2926_cov110-Isochrysis_galbana.AAC.8
MAEELKSGFRQVEATNLHSAPPSRFTARPLVNHGTLSSACRSQRLSSSQRPLIHTASQRFTRHVRVSSRLVHLAVRCASQELWLSSGKDAFIEAVAASASLREVNFSDASLPPLLCSRLCRRLAARELGVGSVSGVRLAADADDGGSGGERCYLPRGRVVAYLPRGQGGSTRKAMRYEGTGDREGGNRQCVLVRRLGERAFSLTSHPPPPSPQTWSPSLPMRSATPPPPRGTQIAISTLAAPRTPRPTHARRPGPPRAPGTALGAARRPIALRRARRGPWGPMRGGPCCACCGQAAGHPSIGKACRRT